MNRHVNAIAGRLSLRPPQRESLEILDRITEITPIQKGADVQAALDAIRAQYPQVSDFEREFPSVCFALATGVGKTRLMGAFISYLHLAHGMNNFFILAPGLTVYNKLIADFTPNTPKYVFKGIAEFVVQTPLIITGDNYDDGRVARTGQIPGVDLGVHINIFNISKINTEVRGGKAPKIKRLSEYVGESYFEYLSGLDDLVLIMDESHRYRASAGVRAINELKPVLGLELTATPFVETPKGPVQFKNVILDYPLGRAIADGYVKEPAVVTRKDFNPAGMSPEEIERLKLEDGVRLHESVKVELETYSRETGRDMVKPFLLVISRDTTHAGQLMQLIQSDQFFGGRYKEKVIQVDSSKTGKEEEEMVERLLKVESATEPTEIVIHVNMLKEGWDVTNLYTIVPLRAANARILIEQSIGRGLRLPYGHRTGVTSVDRLNIIAHDKFQEIVDEASRPDSTIRLQHVILNPDQLQQKTVTVVSQPILAAALGLNAERSLGESHVDNSKTSSVFQTAGEQEVARIAYKVIRQLEAQPSTVPSSSYLQKPEVREAIVREVEALYKPRQLEMEGISRPDVASVVARTAEIVEQQTIDIPRILVSPKGAVRSGFKPFVLSLESMNYQAPSDELWIQHLRTNEVEVVGLGEGGIEERRLEDFIVGGLVDFDDISYDDHADLLYDLAEQAIRHFLGYLSEDEARKVLRLHQRPIAHFIHAQMQEHYWEAEVEYEVKISRGFTELKESAFTASDQSSLLDFRQSPSDKSNMGRFVFGGFSRCLYNAQKFQSDPERRLAVILDRDAQKWFKPAKGQFQIYYKWGVDYPEYQPDFVAETTDLIYMIEPKARNEMDDPQVLAKRDAAATWCGQASEYTKGCEGKPWKYVLIPHDAVVENMSLTELVRLFSVPKP